MLTKLRISAHPLYIETGRYSKPPIPKEKRLCSSCRLFIEDEKHFVYCIVQSTNNADCSIMIYLMLTHILVMTQLEKLLILQILQMREEHVV